MTPFESTPARTPVSRATLGPIVLEAIRKQPGCTAVAELSISEAVIENGETVWRVTILDSGGVDIIRANHAAEHVCKQLQRLYVLQATPSRASC